MFFIAILLLTAFTLSGIAAYYSIIGLTAIFSGAPLPVAVMGASLEVAKLVTASWLYRNWSDSPRWMRYYFFSAVIILMIITSLGIFGYLSKAHIESTLDNSNVVLEIREIEQSIAIQEKNIANAQRSLDNLDDAVEKARPEAMAALRTRQQRERDRILGEITKSNTEIKNLNSSMVEKRKEQIKLESDIGPLKYIAEMVYGSSADNHFDSAVRFVIILLVIVFDPLAVLLIIATNYNLSKLKKENKPSVKIDIPINMTAMDPIAMNKDEIDKATKISRVE
jgi:hypothetical protein